MIGYLKAQPLIERRITALIVIGMLLFLATSLFYQSRIIVTYDETSDFSAYYAAYMTKRVHGQGIYDRANFHNTEYADRVTGGVREYLYPPLMAEALSIFMPSNYTNARLLWTTLEHAFLFLLYLLTIALTISLTKTSFLYATIIATTVVIGFSALERSFFYGQASLVMASLIYLAVWLREQRRTFLAAFIAALATLIKIYPIVYLPALLIKGRFLESVFYLVSLLLIAGAFIIVFGASDWVNFFQFQSQSPLVDRDGMSVEAIRALYEVPNYSPTALIFLLSDQFGWGLSGLNAWRIVKVVALGSAALIVSIKLKALRENMHFAQILALGFVGVMLVSPLLWNHIFIVLIPILAILLSQVYDSESIKTKDLIAITIAFVLIAFPDILTNTPFTNYGAFVLLKFTKLYGLFLLVFVLYPGRQSASNNLDRPAFG